MIARRNARIIRVILGILVLTNAATLAGDFALDWWTADSGGEMWTAGGEFELSGTIGQPDANVTVMTGGDFELDGGFWVIPAGPYCPGDIDGDGDTDHSDLGALLSAWCSVAGDPNWDPNADLDGDGHVGHGDLGILLSDWACGT